MGLFSGIFKKEKKPTNLDRGKEVEQDFKSDSEMQGYNVKRTGVGSDHKRSYRDFNGKKHTETWEEKRNNSPLSERQKKTRGLKVYRSIDAPYGREVRVEDRFGNRLERDILTGKYKKVPKRQTDPFGLTSFTSGLSEKPKRNSRTNSDPFGLNNMFGSRNIGTSRRKRKSNNPYGFDF